MKVGDLVVKKRDPRKILGIVVQLYEIKNRLMHKYPLPMAELMTADGMCVWKRRKLQVISERTNV